ncbi:Phosphoserine phosphatase 1 [Bremerella volcania]|uniref:Phosphoserine phosphatase 1 n=1 Tax=Bremerella volcania TaxID=2527984 RepID=A0A518C363_9BACT|nr:histidine phosphatase family protein [Bremerella volcania]QDU73666.1 Phosphoserine phosphatase 1 [Bremerella volcania]
MSENQAVKPQLYDRDASFDLHALPPMKREIVHALHSVADSIPWVLSATLTGSFLNSDDLSGVSDIDYIVIVDQLHRERFESLQATFQKQLEPVVQAHGWKLRINPTLGPLKFNDEQTAVLHLMLYSREAHVKHVIESPFTCFDWQLSPVNHRASMADIYPAFALQPRHFVSARRSITDYLNDYRARVVSYRELVCNDVSYEERKQLKPMTVRDQHEFAYHIIRFLMKNLVKLLTRSNRDLPSDELQANFFRYFPAEESPIRAFFSELSLRKHGQQFDPPVENLDERLESFAATFEQQFRSTFHSHATRHVVFRHAPTPQNYAEDGSVRFLGRSNPEILPPDSAAISSLSDAISSLDAPLFFSSPQTRCRQSLASIDPSVVFETDDRLQEINYGACEGMTVQAARNSHPALFQAWQQGHDPRFPGGECTEDVFQRGLKAMTDIWDKSPTDTVTCTHNVVLRCLVGNALGVPRSQCYRLKIPHLAPITFIRTPEHGVYLDLTPEVERQIFQSFSDSMR